MNRGKTSVWRLGNALLRHRARCCHVSAVYVVSFFILCFFLPLLSHATVNRIVSLAPSLTETIYALGQEDKLVADTVHCNYPEAAQRVKRIGNMSIIDQELLLSLKPDLVVASKLTPDATVETIRNLGIRCEVFTVDGEWNLILKNNQRLADLLDCSDKGRALNGQMENRLKKVLESIPPERKKQKVLVSYNLSRLYAAGANSWIDSIIKMIGAENVVPDTLSKWPSLNREHLLLKRPDVIFVMDESAKGCARYTEEQLDSLKKDPILAQLPAVNDKRVYVMELHMLMIPGPSIIDTIETFVDLLYVKK